MTRKIAICLTVFAILLVPMIQALDEPAQIRRSAPERDCMRTLDGEVLYQNLCLACHGASGLGNGPAAEHLAFQPSNLTRLAADNGGRFPSRRVLREISGQFHEPVPGTEMPAWDEILGGSTGDEVGARLRVYNLTQYLKDLQVASVD